MQTSKFSEILNDQIRSSREVLLEKAKEYAVDDDRLHNFKIAAVLQGETPAQALGGMMAKHTVSIFDMINSGKSYPKEMWDEKIGDHINYLILLRAVVVENG